MRVVAPKFRLAMIDRLGDGPWKGIYSLVSIIGLVLLVYGFGLAREVSEQGYEAIGAPRYAGYDAPYVPGPFRRNEVMIPIAPRPADR